MRSGNKEAKSRKIPSSNMWVIVSTSDQNTRYRRFLENGLPAFKSFIDSYLLYDQIIIPTQDFISLTILTEKLGENTILDLISSDNLKFYRIKGTLCYMGNGLGIKPIGIRRAKGPEFPFSAPAEESISFAIKALKDKPKDKKFATKILDSLIEVELANIYKIIKQETYNDINNSKYLKDKYKIPNYNLDNLPGINKKVVRFLGSSREDVDSDNIIDVVMLLAQTNLELFLMNETDCEDLNTSLPVGHVVKAKIDRNTGFKKSIESFTKLKEINKVPDIGDGLLTKQIDFAKLSKIKNSKDGVEFRKWFHMHCDDDPLTITKEFVELLMNESKMNTLPMKVIRYFTTLGLGAVGGPLLGSLSNAADSFILDKIFGKKTPKFFIEKLKQIQ
ncbi:hypothetical protein ACFL27_20185 [candidate division CSSED10-310 bacterium]|uniref:Uncharacterized protein n=1 Tax=candidate division CSSED10-310 bacterium TaxID=2855610 RepID=A0ABV6Z243_UNCC1